MLRLTDKPVRTTGVFVVQCMQTGTIMTLNTPVQGCCDKTPQESDAGRAELCEHWEVIAAETSRQRLLSDYTFSF